MAGLNVSTVASAVAANRRADGLPRARNMERALISGALFICALLPRWGWAVACSDWEPVRWESTLRVIDGDTVETGSGERIRLIGINSPELRGDRGYPEPQARRAMRHLKAYVQVGGPFGVLPGSDGRDRHKRTLAHVKRSKGWDLSALQLHHGMAMQVLIGGNTRFAECYQRQERAARQAVRGVWADRHFDARVASAIAGARPGFVRLRGEVRSVSATPRAIWLELDGPVVIKLLTRHVPRGVDPQQWRARRLETRGWLVDRAGSRSVRERGYARYLMRVDHPLLLEWLP